MFTSSSPAVAENSARSRVSFGCGPSLSRYTYIYIYIDIDIHTHIHRFI